MFPNCFQCYAVNPPASNPPIPQKFREDSDAERGTARVQGRGLLNNSGASPELSQTHLRSGLRPDTLSNRNGVAPSPYSALRLSHVAMMRIGRQVGRRCGRRRSRRRRDGSKTKAHCHSISRNCGPSAKWRRNGCWSNHSYRRIARTSDAARVCDATVQP